MGKIVLPEPKYYTPKMLASKWEIDESVVFHYGIFDSLRMGVLSRGWMLERGHYEQLDDNDFEMVPERDEMSYDEWLYLCPSTIREIVSDGKTNHAFFKVDGNKYATLSTNYYSSKLKNSPVIISFSDVYILPSDVMNFESHQNLHFDIKKGIDRTGDPGRPSVAWIYYKEFEERVAKGDWENTLAHQARVLLDWLKDNHKDIPYPTVKTIENRIRALYNKACKSH